MKINEGYFLVEIFGLISWIIVVYLSKTPFYSQLTIAYFLMILFRILFIMLFCLEKQKAEELI